jgi:hypothetical protein
MSELSDPQHEKACLLRADGMPQVDAYATAFAQSPDSASNNSSRFFRRPDIKARVDEIKARRTTLANLNEAWVLVNLKAIAKNALTIGDANLDDFFTKHSDGTRGGIDVSAVSRSKMAALEEVTIEEYTEGRGEGAERIKRTKVKLRSSNEARAALELLGKHLGMWPSKVANEISGPNGGPVQINDITAADRARALMELVNAARKPDTQV